jgi:hypothetical protein
MNMSATTVHITLRLIATCTHSNNTSANRPTEEATTAATHSSEAIDSLPDDYNENESDIDYDHYVSDDSDNDLAEDDDEDAIIPHR